MGVVQHLRLPIMMVIRSSWIKSFSLAKSSLLAIPEEHASKVNVAESRHAEYCNTEPCPLTKQARFWISASGHMKAHMISPPCNAGYYQHSRQELSGSLRA